MPQGKKLMFDCATAFSNACSPIRTFGRAAAQRYDHTTTFHAPREYDIPRITVTRHDWPRKSIYHLCKGVHE